MIGCEPSLLTAGISDDDAQARATSSMTRQAEIASAPAPPYSSGMCTAWKPAAHERVQDVVRELGLVVDLGRARRDLVVGELPHRLAQQLLLLAELVLVECRIPDAHDLDSRTTY